MTSTGSGAELFLRADGESKQTISVRISNEVLRQIHELLNEEKKRAQEALLEMPSMTWLVESLLILGIPAFKEKRRQARGLTHK